MDEEEVKRLIEKYKALRHTVYNDIMVLGHMILSAEGLIKGMKKRHEDIVGTLKELNDD